jgi:Delta7-sterol 5-desaturase
MPDFSSFSGWALATILLFLILALRYFIIGGLLHWIFYIRKHPKWQKRKIFQKDSTRHQLRRELKWSMLSTLIFALSGSLLFFLWQEGLTMIYLEVNGIGWLYLPLSLCILLAMNETYYYMKATLLRPGQLFLFIRWKLFCRLFFCLLQLCSYQCILLC